jgi:type 1 fimbria pilin
MRKSYLGKVFLLFVLGLFLVGCNKDDDSPTPNAELTGVWNCTDVDYTGTSVTEVMGQSITADFVGAGYNIDFTLTIVEDPNEITSDGSYDIKLTTTNLGQSNVQNIENIPFTYVGAWSQEGNIMTIDMNGVTSDATIVELTANSLELNMLDVRIINNGGATLTTTTEMVVKFTK